jgi:hypothetical protein
MLNTPHGRLHRYDAITATYLPHRRPRDVRMRYQTLLKPRLVRGVEEREVLAMRKRVGEDVDVVGGRWCSVPRGWASPAPSESVGGGRAQVLVNPVDGSVVSTRPEMKGTYPLLHYNYSRIRFTYRY